MRMFVRIISAVVVVAATSSFARTFDFKAMGTTGATSGRQVWWGTTEKSKSAWFRVKVGGATKIDDMSEIEIRAGTVFKNVKDKRTGVNDVAKFPFEPINVGKPLFFMISTGVAFSRNDNYDSSYNRGWQLAGCIIEIWQKGKVVKHWSNVPGNGGKSKLVDTVKCLHIDARGYEHNSEYSAFDNATSIYPVDDNGERINIDEVLQAFRNASDADAKQSDQATAKKTYYLIRNVREVEYNRDYILRRMDRGQDCSYVQERKMTKDELADYKIENSNCKVFESKEKMLAFLKTGEDLKTDGKWYFAIRDVNNITMYDKRRALEDITREGYYCYSDSNVLKRKFTDEEVKDFKALNPNCKMFRDVDEFKDFIRNVKPVAEGGPVVRRYDEGGGPVVVRRWSGDGGNDSSRFVITNGTRRFFRTRSSSYGREPQQQPQLSPEELKKAIDVESAHEKEMFERKFGEAGKKHINNSAE